MWLSDYAFRKVGYVDISEVPGRESHTLPHRHPLHRTRRDHQFGYVTSHDDDMTRQSNESINQSIIKNSGGYINNQYAVRFNNCKRTNENIKVGHTHSPRLHPRQPTQ